VLEACRLVAERAGTTLQALLPTVSRFGLGTTAVTNTIASRTGRRVGLVTTSGFEDLVPIARAMRVPSDGWLVPPVPLIDREWIVGVPERIDRNGEVLTKLDMAAVRTRGRRLVAEHGVEALVVSFLWACVNDSHEQAAVDELRLAFPSLTVMSAAELLPVIREYERTQFALLNAYTSGALAGVDELVGALLDLGLPHPPLLVHSGGIHLRRRGPPGSGRSRGVRPGGRCRGGAGGLRGGRRDGSGHRRYRRHVVRRVDDHRRPA